MMTTLAEKRKLKHLEIKNLFHQNLYDLAALEIKKSIQSLGPHIGLLSDLAVAYLHSGRFIECWEVLDQVELEYFKIEILLSNETKRRLSLIVAKLWETRAEPAIALRWLERALNFCLDQEEKKWIHANELRVLSYFGKTKKLQNKYLAILEIYNSPNSLKNEILHALLWSEWALFGFQQVLHRWRELQTLPLGLNEVIFLSREFIQIALRSQYNPLEILMQEALRNLNHPLTTDYDKAMIILSSLELSESSKHLELNELKLSPFMRIQILLIQFQNTKSIELQTEYLKMFQFLVSGLSLESQELYLKIRPEIKSENQIILQLNLSQKRLCCTSPMLDIKITPLQIRLFQAFAKKSMITMDEAAQLLWNYADGDESIYHRLRMHVYKTNDQIASQLGNKPFDITKEGVTLSSLFQLEMKI